METQRDGDVESFAWSPDGERLAYQAAQNTAGLFEIHSSVWNGTENQRANPPLREGGSASAFAWSPAP